MSLAERQAGLCREPRGRAIEELAQLLVIRS